MHDRLSNTSEIVPSSNIADLGGAALVAAEQREASPDISESTIEARESERKRNTTENLRALQKRFGERFIKGNLMEGGGYTGGAARELLAGFMDRPDFAVELKRLIPGKHGALRLLKDNYSYIQATLDQLYKSDYAREQAPVKDPYELARSVGYELTGPFTATSEFVSYNTQDFRPHERLCTFNYPAERLEGYQILWLRHTEVTDTLPADELTEDTLSEVWKTYLKTIGRYNQETDRYNLSGLRPTRDDPYGVSSMSVQISRQGTHVSIKNRYNHTVTNPDNTLDSNLDSVAYGLRRAVYAKVDRQDLMDKTRVALTEGYVVDNDGGIHPYNYEEDNVYYGDYEYIENGVVATIDRGKYTMISPQVYVPTSGNGTEINLRPAINSKLGVCGDIEFLHKSSQATLSEKDSPAAELRRAYAEREWAELTAKLVESLKEQATTAYDAYQDVALGLGAKEIMNEAEFARLLERKEVEWQQNGVLNHLVSELIEKGSQPNLIATPNMLADWSQLKRLAVEFGSDQPCRPYTKDMLYRHYTPGQLSGVPEGELLRLSIIPSSYSLDYDMVDEHRESLENLQKQQPKLGFKVPSVLDSLMLWHSLRARGSTLDMDETYIRHFDLPELRIVDRSCVPESYIVGGAGKPYFDVCNIFYGAAGRLSVG